jgi:SAM-dependent methyltransferase
MLSSPAALRNRQPIANVLADHLPASGTALMIAEGSGEHAERFAQCFPAIRWLPSDPDPAALASIAARQRALGLANLLPPLALDVTAASWPVTRADVVTCINMVHISPRAATEGLLAGAARVLPAGGLLYLYGPYRRQGVPTAPSNEAFDDSLKARDPRWGLRQLEEVIALADGHGLQHTQTVPMPANNLSVLFRRTQP